MPTLFSFPHADFPWLKPNHDKSGEKRNNLECYIHSPTIDSYKFQLKFMDKFWGKKTHVVVVVTVVLVSYLYIIGLSPFAISLSLICFVCWKQILWKLGQLQLSRSSPRKIQNSISIFLSSIGFHPPNTCCAFWPIIICQCFSRGKGKKNLKLTLFFSCHVNPCLQGIHTDIHILLQIANVRYTLHCQKNIYISSRMKLSSKARAMKASNF